MKMPRFFSEESRIIFLLLVIMVGCTVYLARSCSKLESEMGRSACTRGDVPIPTGCSVQEVKDPSMVFCPETNPSVTLVELMCDDGTLRTIELPWHKREARRSK